MIAYRFLAVDDHTFLYLLLFVLDKFGSIGSPVFHSDRQKCCVVYMII